MLFISKTLAACASPGQKIMRPLELLLRNCSNARRKLILMYHKKIEKKLVLKYFSYLFMLLKCPAK